MSTVFMAVPLGNSIVIAGDSRSVIQTNSGLMAFDTVPTMGGAGTFAIALAGVLRDCEQPAYTPELWMKEYWGAQGLRLDRDSVQSFARALTRYLTKTQPRPVELYGSKPGYSKLEFLLADAADGIPRLAVVSASFAPTLTVDVLYADSASPDIAVIGQPIALLQAIRESLRNIYLSNNPGDRSPSTVAGVLLDLIRGLGEQFQSCGGALQITILHPSILHPPGPRDGARQINVEVPLHG